LTILVDFPDEPGTIDVSEVRAYFNDPNYRSYGNNGSVMKYFLDVSQGHLLVTNTVIDYVRMPNKKGYYDNPELG
jgi:M6 family metalloprotease-like protein